MRIYAPPRPPQQQPDEVLNQANPVQNEWYTVLDTKINAQLQSVNLAVLVTDETLEVEVVIDGQTLTGSVAATAGTNYFARLWPRDIKLEVSPTEDLFGRGESIDRRSIRVRIRKTTAAGAGNLMSRVKWAKL